MGKKIKKYIESGDVMQVVISHEVTAYFDIEPIYFYRALRLTNPSPYMSFLIWVMLLSLLLHQKYLSD